jgi:hypothetical protein
MGLLYLRICTSSIRDIASHDLTLIHRLKTSELYLYRAVNTFLLGYKNQIGLCLHRAKVALGSEIDTKHVTTLRGQNVDLLNVTSVVASSNP